MATRAISDALVAARVAFARSASSGGAQPGSRTLDVGAERPACYRPAPATEPTPPTMLVGHYFDAASAEKLTAAAGWTLADWPR